MTTHPQTMESLDALDAVATERLRSAVGAHGPAVFTTSFGAEDMVVLDLIARAGLDVQIVTLDTGRLHDETYQLMERARERYQRPIIAMAPDTRALEAFVAEQGINPFYRSIDLRKRCCQIRKMEPLGRALSGKGLWITGLRRDQSVTRAELDVLARDDGHGLMKLNPIVEWTHDDVWAYVERFDVPTNALHARGFPSIGCAPCTRAVEPGEDLRAGRWWWEQAETRECGLHMTPDGRLVRAPKPAASDPMAELNANAVAG
ncbi:MAG: phosphoadenylyl-sulfate reductase [Burkholderiaceae bacterium]